eukprot:CAMPEP_0113420126 /NCGR_PEP_ID=MMETSP0013_2-20120614/27165_1 /TAXON_ID=2843 ORGANISM="Skeletonema costatum, Strain 1716" /NCGR_SAMPLE_ID=MMETSP0013_2 /ASSEMBLY_ACC=CAM_ASM_000158 /LENGTH=256 /DNA_ID=CAMNT_0000307591 /DNA_START=59 /DNA_END=826 /DNA_ORIENTATION=+ /assembly_acc=CAM_ASM_000158
MADRNEQAAQRGDEESVASSADSNINMVEWRGNLVREKEAKALRHVFDDLQDHFGHQRPDPRITFNTSLAHPGQGEVWNGELDFTYDINGDHCNVAYVSMDVCVDLTTKLVHKHGQPMLKEYGNSWVYVYLPGLTLDKFKSYLKTGTGWDVSDEGTVYDPNRNLVAIEAKMHHESGQPKPSFWVVKDKDASGRDISSPAVHPSRHWHLFGIYGGGRNSKLRANSWCRRRGQAYFHARECPHVGHYRLRCTYRACPK